MEVRVDHDLKQPLNTKLADTKAAGFYHESVTREKGYVIDQVFYHNTSCFTYVDSLILTFSQGLLVDPNTGNIVESCGKYGSSYITVYNPEKKKVYSRKSLPRHVFGNISVLYSLQAKELHSSMAS